MNEASIATRDCAIVGTIGRKRVSFALADEHGALRSETIRSYGSDVFTGVSAALVAFQRDLCLRSLPTRSAFAVAGLVRGDAISVTSTRWFLSRSGLKSMLGKPPLILNDFAAEAWAICTADLRLQEAFSGATAPTLRQAGCYLVAGITSGLGVAAVHRSASGGIIVLPTEAGHGAFAAATDELSGTTAELSAHRHPVAAEDVVSAPGLLAIYKLLARRRGAMEQAKTPETVTRSVQTDPIARAACELLAKAFWAQMGSLVMTFGAWDGVLVTGPLASAIRPFLRLPEAQALFSTSAKYRRVLQSVPRALVAVENAELIGVSEALRHERIALE
jgi:glucokinase